MSCDSAEKEAILALADAVAYIASRCWEALGTKDAEFIVDKMQRLSAALEKPDAQTQKATE